jgi:hypothetical protein
MAQGKISGGRGADGSPPPLRWYHPIVLAVPVAAFAAVLVNVSQAGERHGLLSLYFVRDLAVAIVVASVWFYLAVGVSRLWRRTKVPR